MELLHDGNETVLKLTTRELKSLQRFNRFVFLVYHRSWYISASVVDAPVNDMLMIKRLNAFDDKAIKTIGPAAVIRHSSLVVPKSRIGQCGPVL